MRSDKEYNDTYHAHSRSLYSIDARWLMFNRLLTTQDIDEFKELYRMLTTYKREGKHRSSYVKKNKTTVKFLESF